MQYALEKAKREITELLKNVVGEIEVEARTPPPNVKADMAVSLFKLANEKKQNPAQLAQDIAGKIDLTGSMFEHVEAAGGYVNFTLDVAKFNAAVFQDFEQFGQQYGSATIGQGKTLIIDYSAPNIAKPFSVGHLRSTIIGQALYNIYSFLGYTVIGDNHIGDWGTQFGKLMYAFKEYGDRETITKDPIKELLNLYVKFHQDAETNPALDEEGRKWFKKLEQGDEEAVELWKWFAELSWSEFEEVYELLGNIEFDETLGESFYNDKLQATLQEAFDKTIAVFAEQKEYDNFLSQFPQTKEILAPLVDSLEVKLQSFTLTDKSLKRLKSKGLSNDVLATLGDLKDQRIIGHKKFLSLLEQRVQNEQTAKVILKQSQRNTQQETIFWIDIAKISNHASEMLGQEAIDEIERRTRKFAVWGEVPSGEIKGAGNVSDQEEQEEVGIDSQQIALIRLEEFGIETPLLIQKSDGTSLYATRDLATAKYRVQQWQPAEIMYVVGGEQQLYFQQWTTAFRIMGYKTKCVHVWFGLVRLPEGKMSTRKGRVILLEDVLTESISRVEDILKDRDMSEEEKQEVAKIVGVGAIKYADLSQERTKEVVFDWDKILNMQGNSGPYLQYVYVRIRSILRKAQEEFDSKTIEPTLLADERERGLIKELSRFPEIVRSAAKDYTPHVITNYLFSLAQAFNGYYNSVSIIRTEQQQLRWARLFLCQAIARVLKTGLGLLGIRCPEKM